MLHFSLKSISRSAGRSASGASAYVTASVGRDPWTETSFDYSKKNAPVAVGFFRTAATTAAAFGSGLDSAENRKNSQVARELVISLPHSLPDAERVRLAADLAGMVSDRWDVPTLWAVHRPDRGGDQRNDHMHLLFSTRDTKGKKTRALDTKDSAAVEVAAMRRLVAERIQAALPESEREAWDPRTLAERGIDRPATKHEGPMVRGIRRQGVSFGPAIHNDQVRSLEEQINLQQFIIDNERRKAAAAKAERTRAMAEQCRATLERLGKLAQAAAERSRKIIRFSREQIEQLDTAAGRLDGANERMGRGVGCVSRAVSDYSGIQQSMRRFIQQSSAGLRTPEGDLRGNEGIVPRVSLPSFDLTILSQMIEGRVAAKAHEADLRSVVDFLRDPLEQPQQEEYDEKKHGPLLPSDKPKPKSGPSMGMGMG